MGATYTRQSTYSDGDVIQASDTNDEFNQLLAAFAASTGHTHDGTTAEGGPITKLLGNTLTFGAGTAGTDITITFDGESNDGVLKWMEDEDYFEFSDDILVASTEKIQFGDTATFLQQSSDGVLRIDGEATIDLNASTAVTVSNDLKLDSDSAVLGFGADNDVTLTHVADTALLLNSSRQLQFGDSGTYIHQSADGVLDLVSDTEIEINATTIDINGNADISGTLGVTGAATFAGNVTVDGNLDVTGTFDLSDSNFTNAGDIQLDSITGDGDTNTSIAFSGSDVITVTAGGDAQITFTNGGIIPSVDNDIDLGSSSKEFKDAFFDGTVTTDAIVVAGTIGHDDDTDLLTLADGIVTVAGEISVTTLDIGGTNVTSTAAELNILDGVTSTATELNIMDGDTSATSTTLADADRVVVNDAGTMKQVALTDFETYFESALDTLSNVTTVGALNSGSITSGFGAIDNGSSAITTTGTVTYGSLSDGSITITAFVDEDDMSSNSATLVPTQQSVKAYVDTQLTAEDLDITTDSGTIDIDLDSETLTIAGGTGLSSSASSTTVTMAVDAAQTGITSVVNSSLEIGRDADNRIKFGTDNQIIFEVDGGDNVIFKASGEIEASSLDISGDADIDGTLEADAITVNGTALNTVISNEATALAIALG